MLVHMHKWWMAPSVLQQNWCACIHIEQGAGSNQLVDATSQC